MVKNKTYLKAKSIINCEKQKYTDNGHYGNN